MPRRASSRNNKLSYQTLEGRRVLTASFAFEAVTSLLTIDGFDDVNSDLTIDQSSVSINGGANEDAYIFTLGAGTFVNGGGLPSSEFQISGDTLTVATDVFGANGALDANVLIDGAVGADFVELTQANSLDSIDFNSLQISNFQNEGNLLRLDVVGDVTLDNLSVVNGPAVVENNILIDDLSITTTGSINVVGTLAAIEASGINLNAGEAITMADGALVDAGTGQIVLEAGNNITLGGLRTSGDRIIRMASATGEIIDGGDTDTDIEGIVAIIDAAAGVGSGNALDIQITSFIEVENTTTGDIDLLQESAGGDITVGSLVNDAAVGDTTLVAQDGGIRIAPSAGAASFRTLGGTVTLEAQGAGNDVVVSDGITTVGGDAMIEATGNVVLNFVSLGAGDLLVNSGVDILA